MNKKYEKKLKKQDFYFKIYHLFRDDILYKYYEGGKNVIVVDFIDDSNLVRWMKTGNFTDTTTISFNKPNLYRHFISDFNDKNIYIMFHFLSKNSKYTYNYCSKPIDIV